MSEIYIYEHVLGPALILTVPGSGHVYGSAGYTIYTWDYTTDPWSFNEMPDLHFEIDQLLAKGFLALVTSVVSTYRATTVSARQKCAERCGAIRNDATVKIVRILVRT